MVWHGVHLATIARQLPVLEAYWRTNPELLNRQDNAYGMTPLIWACVMGHEAVVAFLLDHGARIDLCDHGDRSAAFYAAKMGSADLLQTLLGRGAAVTQQSVEGMTPLIIAAACGHEDVVTTLLAHLASDAIFAPTATTATGSRDAGRANTQPTTGAGEIMAVVPATAPALDEAGKAKARLAYLNTTTRRGNSAVHCSARHPAILRRLLNAGVNPTLVNAEGHTVLDIARGKHVPAAVRILERHLEVKESRRVRLLHKARALSDAAHCLAAVAAGDGVRTRGEKRRAVMGAAPAFLSKRVAREEALPAVAVAGMGMARHAAGGGGESSSSSSSCGGCGGHDVAAAKKKGDEEDFKGQGRRRVGGGGKRRREKKGQEVVEVRRAVAAHVVAGGGGGGGLKPELFLELMEFMCPKWDEARRPQQQQA